jgi:hypothetical protein
MTRLNADEFDEKLLTIEMLALIFSQLFNHPVTHSWWDN